ncbi:WHG domain-containing protein [Pseudonocardiaceae bacterium YIM PH 21723]|nr:WHG domain-containing protein [Pseudonocardiaceae bacterium YIM PH 21723]
MARPRIHDDTLRLRLLELSSAMLATDGPNIFSLRKLAIKAGTSTTAVYSLFGGKPALLAAVHREAFRRFAEVLASVPTTNDPTVDLYELGMAYRKNAIANPHFYAIMFTGPFPGFQPESEVRAEVDATFQVLKNAVQRCVDAGRVSPDQLGTVTFGVWGTAHGLVSLELSDMYPPDTDIELIYRAALMPFFQTIRPMH